MSDLQVEGFEPLKADPLDVRILTGDPEGCRDRVRFVGVLDREPEVNGPALSFLPSAVERSTGPRNALRDVAQVRIERLLLRARISW